VSVEPSPFGYNRPARRITAVQALEGFMTNRTTRIGAIGVSAFAIACVAVCSGAQAPQRAAQDRLRQATQVLAGPQDTVTTQKLAGAIIELLDLASILAPDNEYRKDILYRIDVAKELITKTSLFNDKARQYVSFAYRQMTNGVKFEPPKDLQEFVTPAEFQAKSLKYMKGLLDKAETSLAAGRTAETAKTLLEIVLMIMTPVAG
jgi:hypothetical protein